MKVCFVCFAGYPDQGATYAYEMSRSVARLGHAVTVVAAQRPGEPEDITLDGVRVLRIGTPLTMHWASPARWLRKARFMREAARVIRAGSFDVVHVYCTIGAGALPLAAGRRARWVQEHQTGAVSSRSRFLRWLEDRVRAGQGRLFDANLTVSRELGERLFGARGRFEEMPAGVNLQLFSGGAPRDFRAEHGIPDDDVVFVHAGVLEATRFTDVPIRALAIALKVNPRLRLLMPGKGAQLEELRALAQELGIADRVWLPGYVPYASLPRVFGAADAGLSYLPPTRYYEGQLPMKVMEYMGAGLPVLATDVSSHRVLVRHGHNGLLCEPNAESYAHMLVSFAADPALRRQLADNAPSTVDALTYDRIAAERLLPIYTRLAATR
jgi:glycosyltransferase involved in cell wall biosynthesis